MNRELLQQALDALEFSHDSEWSNKAKAIEALQHALTQPEQAEQEPIAQIRVKRGHWIETPRSIKVKSLPDGLHDLYTAPPRKEWERP